MTPVLLSCSAFFLAFVSIFCDARIHTPQEKFFQKLAFPVRSQEHLRNEPENPVEPPLLVGSFNIQTLGKKKFNNPKIMMIIEKIIQRYDLILVMEIMTVDMRHMDKLLRDVNKFGPKGVVYNMTLSESHPYTKEFCAFFYRTNKLELIRTENYNDPENFYRKPYVAIFISPTLRDVFRFGVVGQHVKPSQAVQEMNGLADLYDVVSRKYNLKDFLIMGDFNADCSYVGENDWSKISLWTRDEFLWIIENYMDTTTNHRSCALDRVVAAGMDLSDGIILSSARVYDYQEEFGLSTNEVRNISDHWPVEFKIRGKLSRLAEKYLNSDICFSVQDSRSQLNISASALKNAAAKAGFTVTVLPTRVYMMNKTRDIDAMFTAIETLQEDLPDVITHELLQAVKYKVLHGSLEDESSFADVPYTIFKVEVTETKSFSKILTCRTTSVN